MVPAQSLCSADTAHIAVGRPNSAPSAMALHGLLMEVYPRIRSSWGSLGSQTLTLGDGAAVRMEIKALLTVRPLRVEEWRAPWG